MMVFFENLVCGVILLPLPDFTVKPRRGKGENEVSLFRNAGDIQLKDKLRKICIHIGSQ